MPFNAPGTDKAQPLTPVLFISHGAPTFALEPGKLGPQLQALGQQLEGVRAVLVVSPHWQTRGVRVGGDSRPETIHDFGGFASLLYELQYPAPGAPELARQTAELLAAAGYDSQVDAGRGLDHGAWVPLRHLLPRAEIPVFQVSMPYALDTAQALELGQALAPLRAQGVLILASGSMTHNLSEFRQGTQQAMHYVQEFADWVHQAVRAHALPALVQYRSLAPHAVRAHPTEEHFLPLLVALGALQAGDTLQHLDGGVQHGMLSMDSFAWGLPTGGAPLPH